MQVGMKMQILPPAMQHGEEPEFHAQTLGVAGNGEQGLGGGAEEDIVDGLFVVEGDGGDGLGEREDHVEVLGGQQLFAALLQPFFACGTLTLGAMAVAARAISSVRVLAMVAPFDGTAQQRRPAGLDGLHQAMLMQGQGMGLPVGGAVLSKDVGQLQGWLGHQLFGCLGLGGLSSRSSGLVVAPTVAGETAV